MRSEVFRMERVSYAENGAERLKDLNLHIFKGEVFGLLPLNSYGLSSLLEVISDNLPLQYGFIFYQETLINNWRHPRPRSNRISLILNRSQLVEGLTLSDNVFVLRREFHARYISRSLLNTQLEPYFRKLGVDIPPDTYPEKLTPYQRIIVEIIRSMVAGHKLIVLYDVDTLLNENELNDFHRILRQCTEDGFSFLYIGFQPERLTDICSRVGLFSAGRLLKTVETPEGLSSVLVRLSGAEAPSEADSFAPGDRPVFCAEQLHLGGKTVSFSLFPGECVILQDPHGRITAPLADLLSGSGKPEGGSLLLEGKPFSRSQMRDVAVIRELPSQTMLFPQMSYFDNLFLCADQHLPHLWLRSLMQRRLAKEYARRNGADLFARSVPDLTEKEKYDLVYNRILLQKPKVAVFIHPFKGTDMEMREHILTQLSRFRKDGISVIIIAGKASDVFPVTGRVISL